MRRSLLFLMTFYVFMARGQDCDEILRFKAEEYYINVAKKPDSLSLLSCKLIQRQLSSNSVYIDISESEMNNEPIFIAIIIWPKGEPEVIEIPIKLKDSEKKQTVKAQSAAETERGVITEVVENGMANELTDYKNFWAYLEPSVGGTQNIYYSPSRLLSLVNLKFLKNGEGSYLFENHNLTRLHSGASFLGEHKRVVLPRKMDVLLVGNLSYDCRPGSKETWSYLPGTKTELNDIKKILSANHYIRALDSCAATEAKLAAMINSGRFDIVHFATHGFYFKDNEASLGVGTDTYPMERGGIVLSGANSKTASVDVFNKEGLLTAMEMQELNLSNIKFMVLSTCHSGEGDNSENTATLGMTLALMRNGIQAMMISNRAVPDKETSTFMKTFYGFINANGDIDDSYMKTIRKLYQDFPKTDWSFFDIVH